MTDDEDEFLEAVEAWCDFIERKGVKPIRKLGPVHPTCRAETTRP